MNNALLRAARARVGVGRGDVPADLGNTTLAVPAMAPATAWLGGVGATTGAAGRPLPARYLAAGEPDMTPPARTPVTAGWPWMLVSVAAFGTLVWLTAPQPSRR